MISREPVVIIFVLFQIDDQRRTHNYDEFICTFISMLAQEGKKNMFLPWKAKYENVYKNFICHKNGSVNFLLNVSFCVPLKESLIGLQQHESSFPGSYSFNPVVLNRVPTLHVIFLIKHTWFRPSAH